MFKQNKISKISWFFISLLSLPGLAFAEDSVNGADTAWIMISTALVLFMTLPGLALFYGGLVRTKNVLSVLMQCFAITSIVSVLWLIAGYSLAFGNGGVIRCLIGWLLCFGNYTMGWHRHVGIKSNSWLGLGHYKLCLVGGNRTRWHPNISDPIIVSPKVAYVN
mgnify:CR=1 FL=1